MLLLVLPASLVGGVYMWRQVRYPSARMLASERAPRRYSGWRLHLATYLLYPVALLLAGLAYQALEWSTPLAIAGAFATSMACLPGVMWVTERFSARRFHDT